MATIADLIRQQQETDVLVTRAYRAHLGATFGCMPAPTGPQLTLLCRMQHDSNLRLEALVERMEKANASKEERIEIDAALEESNPCTPDP